MGIDSKLSDLAEDIRQWAVKRMFEEEGYVAAKEGEDTSSSWWEVWEWGQANEDLTVERYESGASTFTSGKYGTSHEEDPNHEYIARQGSDVWNLKYKKLDWVEETITKFGKGNPGELKSLLDGIKNVPFQLMGQQDWKDGTDALERAEDSGSYIDSSVLLENGINEMGFWDGAAATKFVTTFGANGDKWTEVVQGNYYLSEALVRGVEAQLAIIIAAREDIVRICEETREALKSIDNSPDLSLLLAITGAVTTATLTIASFGTASALAGAAFAITGALVANAEQGETETGAAEESEYDIGGDTPTSILVSMSAAISGLTSSIFDKEQAVADALETIFNSVLSNKDDGDPGMDSYEISFGEPTLTDYGRGDLGERNNEADLEYLKEAAQEAFPAAASRMLTAHEKIASSPGNVETAFNAETYELTTTVCAPWTALRDLLQDLTASNGETVKHTGEVILEYAKEAGVVDADSAGELERSYEDLEIDVSDVEHEPIG